MLWIALHLPQLPLEAILRSQPESETERRVDHPLVVCEHKTVGWHNGPAGEAGIRPGMSEGNARALAADLQIHTRQPLAERQALQEAALWALHFTPLVALQEAGDGFMADISASLRLFGGKQRLATRLLEGIGMLGLRGAIGHGSTASAAWLMAKAGRSDPHDTRSDAMRLDILPLQVLTQVQPYLDTLHGIGCHCLGQLRQLPRSGIVRRFGQALLDECDRAYGQLPEVHGWFTAPPVFEARLELAARVEQAESLLFAARRLLVQLTGWLSARHAAAHLLVLQLHHEPSRRRDHRFTSLTLALGMASRDLEHLTLLLRERLAQLVLEAPVIELSLKVEQISEQVAPNTELFPTPAHTAQSLNRLMERLQSRLGNDAVQRLHILADHRPERSVERASITTTASFAKRMRNPQEIPLKAGMRPVWLLAMPLPLRTHQHKPYYHTPLQLLTGPERIETGWWDDDLATRDYFIAQSESHVLYWIFRTRINNTSSESGWFLHGLFG
ncbi:DNA polymerase Y family protein [uncultured Oxalicibacterium sp.]|uniref:Y-family DNA polymerase n=1 Tax=uncultured Oxalicibacterium sp. TaxID=1168540 RepID=UPI0025DC5957|nr:DNA polymerase Y family protein [uncultured Oxalicibacterium sp.]